MAAITLEEATARYFKGLEPYQTLGTYDQLRVGHLRAHMERLIVNAQAEGATNPMKTSYQYGYVNGIRAVLNNLSNLPNERVL